MGQHRIRVRVLDPMMHCSIEGEHLTRSRCHRGEASDKGESRNPIQ